MIYSLYLYKRFQLHFKNSPWFFVKSKISPNSQINVPSYKKNPLKQAKLTEVDNISANNEILIFSYLKTFTQAQLLFICLVG